MRRIGASVLAVAWAGVAAAGEPAAKGPLDGYWKPRAVEYDGVQQVSAESGAALTLVVAAGEYRAYWCPDPAKDAHVRLFTAALTADPAAGTFELAVTDGPKKGERRHGIYKVADGLLTVCYGPADKPRPAAFAAPKGSGLFHEVWAAEPKTK